MASADFVAHEHVLYEERLVRIMSAIETITDALSEMRVTNTQKKLLAEISESLEKLAKGTQTSHELTLLEARLETLAIEAAGRYSTTIINKSAAPGPNDSLAKVWKISFDKLAAKKPVLAAKVAYKIALDTGSGCMMGRIARFAAIEKAPLWAEENFQEATEALHKLSQYCPSAAYTAGDRNIFAGVAGVYADSCNPDNPKHVSMEVVRNMDGFLTTLLSYDVQPKKKIQQEALDKIAGKILLYADKLATDYPNEVSALITKLSIKIADVKCDPQIKQDLAHRAGRAAVIDNIKDFEETLKTIEKLSQNKKAAENVVASFLKNVLDNDNALVEEDPVYMAQRIADLVMPYAEQYPVLIKKAEKTWDACLKAITEMDDFKRLAAGVKKYPAVYDRVIRKVNKKAMAQARNKGVAKASNAFDMLLYVASSSSPYSARQMRALDKILVLLDRMKDDDPEQALNKAIEFVAFAGKIGQQQYRAITGIFEIASGLEHERYKNSARIVRDFMRNAPGDTAISKKHISLLAAIADKDMKTALDALRKQTSQGNFGISPIALKALEQFDNIIREQEQPEERATSWARLALQTKGYYRLENLAGQRFMTEINNLAEQQGKKAALAVLYNFACECIKENRHYSDVYYRAKDRMINYVDLCVVEDLETATEYLKKIQGNKTLENFGDFRSKKLLVIKQKLKTERLVTRLAENMGVNEYVVREADYSQMRLSLLYNKHAFWDWLDHKMNDPVNGHHDNRVAVAATVWGASSLWLLFTHAASFSTPAKIGVVAGCMFAGALVSALTSVGVRHMATGQDKLAEKLITQQAQKLLEENPLELAKNIPERLTGISVRKFMARHNQDNRPKPLAV